ncbi:MAG: PAS domain-containing protein [Pseudooceanicola sp.]
MDNIRNIIDMSPFIQDHRYPAIREVEGYWQGLRGGRLVPRRSEIDPRGIERALEFAFIIERIAPGIARLRIAGSHLSDLMGMEVRGMPLSSFFAPSARSEAGDLIEQVFRSPATAELTLSAERGIGKPAIDARMILLPMKSDLGDMSRALGCLSTHGAIGRSPRRFEISGTIVKRLIHDDGVNLDTPGEPAPTAHADPATSDAPDPVTTTPGFNDPRAAFQDDKPGVSKGRASLRLVTSRDD